MPQEYWREQLDRDEKKLYDNMVFAFSRFEEQVSCGNLTPEVIQRVYVAVCDDHPELYYLPYNVCLQKMTSLFGSNTTLIINNIFSAEQIRKINQQIESVRSKLAVQLSNAKKDKEKEHGICEYLIANTTYEIDNFYNQNAATVICKYKGQCSGIAKATKFLLDCFGIDAIVVNGTATDVSTGQVGPHAWNIVKIDGEYFHLDVTFMMGSMQKNKPYRFPYYNYCDEDIKKDHAWDENSTPRCQKTMKVANTADGTEGRNIVISSLFELRKCLKKSISDCEHCLIFESRIQLPAEKLISAVQNCCRDVISSLGKKMGMEISIQGNVVNIKW